MSDLKPCPFCGRLPMTVKDSRYPDWAQTCCETAECTMQGRYTDVDIWNMRADPAPADGESVMGVVQLHDNHCKEEDYCHCAVVVPKSWEYRKVRVTLV